MHPIGGLVVIAVIIGVAYLYQMCNG